MLTESAEALAARAYQPVESHPGPAQIARLAELLSAAKKPVAILGGTRWSAEAVAGFQGFAECWHLPVGCSFRRQMLFDHLHPNYAGDVGIGINPALESGIKDADLVLLIGGRFSEMPSSGYTLMDVPYPRQTLVHVHPDPAELGRVYRRISRSPQARAISSSRSPTSRLRKSLFGPPAPPPCTRPISDGPHLRKRVRATCRWGRS